MNGERRRWLDEPRNVTRLVWALGTICVLLLLADFFYDKHAHFTWEDWPFFFGLFGFAAFFFIVLLGKQLRRLLMRDEDYYDR